MIANKYYARLCNNCKRILSSPAAVSSGHARWQRSIDLEDHEADIQQPYNADGTPNGRFARMYPDKARMLFTEDELRKAT